VESQKDGEKKRGKGRPVVDSEAISLRLPRELLDAVDELRRQERDLPARPEMIRRMMIKFLEDIEKNRKS
jgi:metal-responsive CopG/Arc/MetJ family transcriptional regulator